LYFVVDTMFMVN